ncbi:MAG: formyltransferase family protein [Acidimicrobiales bacterium]
MPSSAPSGAALPTPPRHPRRLVYLGTPKMAVPPLHALCDAGFEVALVVTGADKRRGRRAEPSPTPVKLAAIERGLPVSHDLADVPGAGADLGVVVAYGRILRRELLEVLPMVNLHFSLLPRWRGAAPVERALLAGDQRTGVCVMAVEEGLDTGGVYARADLAIRRTSTAAELGGQLTELGSALLVDALRTGLGEPEPQVGEPTYAAKLGTDDLRLRWARPAAELDRLVRVGGVDHLPGPPAEGRRGPPVAGRRPRRPAGRAARRPRGHGRRSAAARGGAARGPPAHPVRLVGQRGPARRRRAAGRGAGVSAPARRRSPRPGARREPAGTKSHPPDARRVAVEALVRIERDGAYANLVLPKLLERSRLAERDRAFATQLVYGTVRPPGVRLVRGPVRAGRARSRGAGRPAPRHLPAAHPRHAGPRRGVGHGGHGAPTGAGLVNAVLRKVAEADDAWPSEAVRLSYPDWVVDRLVADLGPEDAVGRSRP